MLHAARSVVLLCSLLLVAGCASTTSPRLHIVTEPASADVTVRAVTPGGPLTGTRFAVRGPVSVQVSVDRSDVEAWEVVASKPGFQAAVRRIAPDRVSADVALRLER